MNNINQMRHKIAILANDIFQFSSLREPDNKGKYTEYVIPWDKDVLIKEDVSKETLKNKLFSTFKEILEENETDIKGNIVPALLFDKAAVFLLRDLLKNSDIEVFKITLSVFEKIVNTPDIRGTTAFYRSMLLNRIGAFELKNFEGKIDYICRSEVMGRENNVCDKNTDKDQFMMFSGDFYSSFVPVAWNMMSVFSDNETIVKNAYPDKTNEYLEGYMVRQFMDMRKSQKIDLSKIDSELLINKFSIPVLSDIQSQLSTGKLKKSINKIIENNLSLEHKKQLILEPLGELKLNSFEEMKKMYPGVFELITIEDVWKMPNMAFNIRSFSDDRTQPNESPKEDEPGVISLYDDNNGENYNKLKPLVKKYGIILINKENRQDNIKILVENIWKIVSKQQIDKQKKELKKSVGKIKKTSKSETARL